MTGPSGRTDWKRASSPAFTKLAPSGPSPTHAGWPLNSDRNIPSTETDVVLSVGEEYLGLTSGPQASTPRLAHKLVLVTSGHR